MTKIALISDIHGNLQALKAVINDIENQQCDRIICLGDVCNCGPKPKECLELVKDRCEVILLGNHEEYLLGKHIPESEINAPAWSGLRWVKEQLSIDDLAYLKNLLFSYEIKPTFLRAAVCFHATALNTQDVILEDSPDEEVQSKFSNYANTDFFIAHTHRPYQRFVDSNQIINIGSVGMPLNKDYRAQYGIISLVNEEWHYESQLVDYDTTLLVEDAKTTGYLDAGGNYAKIFLYQSCSGILMVHEYTSMVNSYADKNNLSFNAAYHEMPMPIEIDNLLSHI